LRPYVVEDKCIGCGKCFDVCPMKPKVMKLKEIKGKGIKSIIIHPEVCDFGAACV
jgi:ferredoxin